ncbi:MAG: ECF-type sigma factor [Myxococcota bacterium]
MDKPDLLDSETYKHLHQLAMRVLGNQAQTLQPTGLLHEAWMRLARSDREYADKKHFMRTAAQAMRQIIIDRVRARGAAKRGGNPVRTTMAGLGNDPRDQVDILEIDQMIKALEAVAPQAADVVLMRTFGGLTTEEAAEALGVSAGTVKRHWRFARAWLLKHANS